MNWEQNPKYQNPISATIRPSHRVVVILGAKDSATPPIPKETTAKDVFFVMEKETQDIQTGRHSGGQIVGILQRQDH